MKHFYRLSLDIIGNAHFALAIHSRNAVVSAIAFWKIFIDALLPYVCILVGNAFSGLLSSVLKFFHCMFN